MKLHWSPRSPFVRKVMIAAHELGIADRINTVRTVVAMRKPNAELLPDNPLSKIPTLMLEDGTALYDSLTICEYLNDRAGGALFPTGAARWAVLTRHALATGFLDALILWRNERDKPTERQDAAWIESFAVKTKAMLAHLENHELPKLKASPVDISHITVAVALSYLEFRFADLKWQAGHPALAAWHAEFKARPSMINTTVVDDA